MNATEVTARWGVSMLTGESVAMMTSPFGWSDIHTAPDAHVDGGFAAIAARADDHWHAYAAAEMAADAAADADRYSDASAVAWAAAGPAQADAGLANVYERECRSIDSMSIGKLHESADGSGGSVAWCDPAWESAGRRAFSRAAADKRYAYAVAHAAMLNRLHEAWLAGIDARNGAHAVTRWVEHVSAAWAAAERPGHQLPSFDADYGSYVYSGPRVGAYVSKVLALQEAHDAEPVATVLTVPAAPRAATAAVQARMDDDARLKTERAQRAAEAAQRGRTQRQVAARKVERLLPLAERSEAAKVEAARQAERARARRAAAKAAAALAATSRKAAGLLPVS